VTNRRRIVRHVDIVTQATMMMPPKERMRETKTMPTIVVVDVDVNVN
jgi:hypothetical protein